MDLSRFLQEIYGPMIQKQLEDSAKFSRYLQFQWDVTNALLHATLTGMHCPQLVLEGFDYEG